jgi:Gametolysin peptidase M11
VLLVQVSTDDENTNVNDTAFESAFFANDAYSVASHWNDCSAGRAGPLVPYLTDGANTVLSVLVEGTSASFTRTTLFLAAKAAVESKLNLTSGLGAAVDHVVFCVPPGLSGPTFLASGAFNSFWIVANSTGWCTNAAVLQHELGHLYGLKHAGQGDLEYGDESSLMGQTYLTETKTGWYRCFNGQNFWSLGWFADLAMEVSLPPNMYNIATPSSTKIVLATFVDVDKNTMGHAVVVKVLDLYLVYNRRKGYNADTGDFPDMVTIVRQLDSLDSSLLAGLDDSTERNMFRYDTGGALPLTIQVCDRLDGDATSPDRFTVGIGYDKFPCVSSISSTSPTAFPTVGASRVPITLSPTAGNPTASPSLELSSVDTLAPSMRPSYEKPSRQAWLVIPSQTSVPTLYPSQVKAASENNTSLVATPTSTSTLPSPPTGVPTLAPPPISTSNGIPTLYPSQDEAASLLSSTSTVEPTSTTQTHLSYPTVAPQLYTQTLSSKRPSTIGTQAPFPPINSEDVLLNPKNNKSQLGLSVGLSVSLVVLLCFAAALFHRRGRNRFMVKR